MLRSGNKSTAVKSNPLHGKITATAVTAAVLFAFAISTTAEAVTDNGRCDEGFCACYVNDPEECPSWMNIDFLYLATVYDIVIMFGNDDATRNKGVQVCE